MATRTVDDSFVSWRDGWGMSRQAMAKGRTRQAKDTRLVSFNQGRIGLLFILAWFSAPVEKRDMLVQTVGGQERVSPGRVMGM